MNIQKKLIKRYIIFQLIIYTIFSISIYSSDYDLILTYGLFIVVTSIIILNSIIVIHYYYELNKFDTMLTINHYCALRNTKSLKQSQANLHIKRNDIYEYELSYLFLKYKIPIPQKKIFYKVELKFLHWKYFKWIYLILFLLFLTIILYMLLFSNLFYENLSISLVMLGIYFSSILLSFVIGFKLVNFMKKNKKLLQNELAKNKNYMLFPQKEFMTMYKNCFTPDIPLIKLESHVKNVLVNNNQITIDIVNDDILSANESIIIHPVTCNSK